MADSDLIEEFFGKGTSSQRKKEIENLIRKSGEENSEIFLNFGKTIKSNEGVDELRNRVRNLKNPSRKHSFFKIAASIVLIASASIFLIKQFTQQTPEEIYQAYYTPYPVGIIRGEETNGLKNFYMLYQAEKYQEAIEEFNMSGSTLESDLLSIYLGNCYLNTDHPEKAIGIFENVKDGKHTPDAIWFTALSHIKSGQIDQARENLQLLSEGNSIYAVISSEVLEELQ